MKIIGNYLSPAKDETIDVKVTLKEGIISSVTVTPQSENEISLKNQVNFANGIADLVIGKEIDAIETFASVNGASLTPIGFQNALEKIKNNAKAQ